MPDPIPSAEEFAHVVFLCFNEEGDLTALIRARDAAVRAEAIEACAKAAEEIDADDAYFWSKNYEVGGSDFCPGAFREAIAAAIRALAKP